MPPSMTSPTPGESGGNAAAANEKSRSSDSLHSSSSFSQKRRSSLKISLSGLDNKPVMLSPRTEPEGYFDKKDKPAAAHSSKHRPAVHSHSSILRHNINAKFSQQYQQQERVYLNGIKQYRNRYKRDDDYYNRLMSEEEEDEEEDEETTTDDDESERVNVVGEDLDEQPAAEYSPELEVEQAKKHTKAYHSRYVRSQHVRREKQALRAISQQVGMPGQEYEVPSEYTLDSSVLLTLLERNEDIRLQDTADNSRILERMEWQSMLESVLTGDVVTGEKTKMSRPTSETENYLRASYKEDLWLGIRAKLFGRTEDEQRRLVVYYRGLVDETLNEILAFKLDLPAEVAQQSYADQVKYASGKVNALLDKYEHCQELWRTQQEMENEKPLCASPEFVNRINALVAWTSVARAIDREASVLRRWVGNDDLDILRPNVPSPPPTPVTGGAPVSRARANSTSSMTPVGSAGSLGSAGSVGSVSSAPKRAFGSFSSAGSATNSSSATLPAVPGKNNSTPANAPATSGSATSAPATNTSATSTLGTSASGGSLSATHILKDERSFVERIMKEKDVKDAFNRRLFASFSHWTFKAKDSYLAHHKYFVILGLPSYLDNLFVLAKFPSKLMKEMIKLRLAYARKLKAPTFMLIDQVLDDLKDYITLALEIRISFLECCAPMEGWVSLVDYQDTEFNHTVIECVHDYVSLLNHKLLDSPKAAKASKVKSFRTFKEPEELEKQWRFLQNVGFYIDGASQELAVQFSTLASKLATRLNHYVQNQLQGPPFDEQGLDRKKMISWYATTMENYGHLRRKLLRFTHILNTYLQNMLEFDLVGSRTKRFLALLKETNHVLYYSRRLAKEGLYVFASPSLADRPGEVTNILRASHLGVDFSRIDKRDLQVLANYEAADVDASIAAADSDSLDYVLVVSPSQTLMCDGIVYPFEPAEPLMVHPSVGKVVLLTKGAPEAELEQCGEWFRRCVGDTVGSVVRRGCCIAQVDRELRTCSRQFFRMTCATIDAVPRIRSQCRGVQSCQELANNVFLYVREMGRDAVRNMGTARRCVVLRKLIRMSLEWLSFVVDDCVPTDPKTFRWCVTALEFAMDVTKGFNILTLDAEDFYRLKSKVADCMSLLISHFDIMGVRTKELQRERLQEFRAHSGKNMYTLDDRSLKALRRHMMGQIAHLEGRRHHWLERQQSVGRVLDSTNTENRILTYLASSFCSVSIRWQKGKFLGGGTFGSVYAAVNLDTGGSMAVKEIRLQDRRSIEEIVRAIKSEMTVLQMMSHPNIVSFFGVEVHRDRVYIFMEYCSGGSLAALLEFGRIEDEAIIQLYTLQMVEGLAYLHQFGIMHRDIKPENVLLDHMGVIKLIDFGSSKIVPMVSAAASPSGSTSEGGLTPDTEGTLLTPDDPSIGTIESLSKRSRNLTGTPMYMSPEAIKGGDEGRFGAIDIWALGCCVLEMATGRRPWADLDNEFAVMYNIATGHRPELPTQHELSRKGQQFLARCLETDPSRRPTAVELLQDPWIQSIRKEAFGEEVSPVEVIASAGAGK